jgi:phage terminase small subunit
MAQKRTTKPTDRRSADNNRVDEHGLGPNERAFVQEYFRTMPRNAGRAYMRAYQKDNAASARVQATKLMKKPTIRAVVAAEEERLATEAHLDAKNVVRSLLRNRHRAELKGQLPEVRKTNVELGRAIGMFQLRMIHTGPDDGPVRVQHDLTKLSVEQLRELDAMEQRAAEILAGAAPAAAQGPA